MANYDGNEGTMIKLSDGATLTAAFRSNYPSQNKAYFFGKNKLNQILGQTNCMGIRIYFGCDPTGNLTLVLVGALANNDDMCSGYVLDYGTACPTSCGSNDSLNS